MMNSSRQREARGPSRAFEARCEVITQPSERRRLGKAAHLGHDLRVKLAVGARELHVRVGDELVLEGLRRGDALGRVLLEEPREQIDGRGWRLLARLGKALREEALPAHGDRCVVEDVALVPVCMHACISRDHK